MICLCPGAEDTDNSRAVFWSLYGRPDRTLLHGQSWGGNVAAKASELYIGDAASGWNYDGVLITNGVVSGGTRAYGFRADLRAVYQYYCANHPAPDEPAYPLWQGLPLDSRMTRAEMRALKLQMNGHALNGHAFEGVSRKTADAIAATRKTRKR